MTDETDVHYQAATDWLSVSGEEKPKILLVSNTMIRQLLV